MPKQSWLEIIESASKPKKGTKIPKGMDLYSLMNAMSNAGMAIVPANTNEDAMGGGLEPWNTGAGANGVVEPGKAVTLDKSTTPPSVYHEGETVYPFPGGKKIVPAQTEEEQQDLGMMEKEESLPGYATGGTVYEDPNSITPVTSTRPTNTLGLSPQATEYQAGQNQAFRTTRQRAEGIDPLMENITNRALQTYDTRAGVSDIEARQGAASNPNLTTGAQNAIVAKQKATYRAGLSDLTGSLAAENMGRAEAANTELFGMGRTGVQDELNRQVQEKTFGEQQYQSDVSRGQWEKAFGLEKQKYGDTEFGRMADDAQTTSMETWLKRYPGATAEDYNVAREFKTRQLQSADIANLTASENYSQLKDSARWSEAENFLRAGDYANYAAIVKDVTGRDISTSDFAADRAYLEQTRALGVTAAELQNIAAQVGVDSAKLETFIRAVNNGADLATANAASGLSLTQDQMNGVATQYRQTVASNEIALDGARNSLGDALYNSTLNMIGNGSTLSSVNQRLSEQGKRPINMQEYTAMRNASGVGQMEWERKLQAFNTLVQSGDPTNIKTAASQFSEMFPGVTFSPDQLINDIGAERFATAMTDLSTLANSFDTWDEAETSVEGLKILETMGIGRGEAKDIFRSMKINVIDDEWSAISDSQWYKNLQTSDPNSAALIQDTFAAGLTGELEFDIRPVYNITDSSGNFVKAFDNIADANKFIGENATSGYTVQTKQNYVYKDMGTGDVVTVNNGTGEATTVNGSGVPDTVQTVAARFAKAGSDYTEDDIQAFKDANNRLPIDTKEMDDWDNKQYNMTFWNKIGSTYPSGSLITDGSTPKISESDLSDLLDAKNSGDKRADEYFIDDTYISQIPEYVAGIKSGYDASMATAGKENINPGSFSQYVNAENNIINMLNNSVGKLMVLDGTPYVIMGTETKKDGVKAVFYNTETKQNVSNYISWRKIKDGFDGIVK